MLRRRQHSVARFLCDSHHCGFRGDMPLRAIYLPQRHFQQSCDGIRTWGRQREHHVYGVDFHSCRWFRFPCQKYRCSRRYCQYVSVFSPHRSIAAWFVPSHLPCVDEYRHISGINCGSGAIGSRTCRPDRQQCGTLHRLHRWRCLLRR